MRSAFKWFQGNQSDPREEELTKPNPSPRHRPASASASAVAATTSDCDSTSHTHFAADTDSPGSLNSASLTQSPSPQPETPTDQFMSGTGPTGSSSSITGTTFSKPINISTPPHHETSTSSRRDSDLFIVPDADFDHCDTADMTTGPAPDPSMGRPRENSFVSAGPKPISVNNSNRDNVNRNRRESLAGSLMGGMSWGGMSFGSFVRDE